MTLRDYFAAKAMQALISRQEYAEIENHEIQLVSQAAYAFANGMIAARQRIKGDK